MKTLSIFLTALFLFSCNSSENSDQSAQNQTEVKKPFNRDSLITAIRAERDTLLKYAENPITPSIAGTLHFNRFKLYQKHFNYWQEYNFYPDVQPVIKEYGEVLKRAMAANFPQIRKSYLLELERNSNYKGINFEAVDKSLLITSDRFQDTSAMRTLHERLKPQAEKYRFEVMQYFGAPKPFVVNLESFTDDTIVFTP
ncbi:MAG: hypothetical protein V4642_00420 [Bacteroidota bacterium]